MDLRDGKGGWLLEKNPFKGFGTPKESSPQRPMLSAQEFAALRVHARAVHPMFEAMLVVMFETGHRGASVRSLKVVRRGFPRELDSVGPGE